MKVLRVEPKKKPEIVDIDNTLEALQEAVGGYIQACYPFDSAEEVAILCNEEGKLNGMKPNRVLRFKNGVISDVIFWPFVIVGLTPDDFGSIPDNLVGKYTEMFSTKESYFENVRW